MSQLGTLSDCLCLVESASEYGYVSVMWLCESLTLAWCIVAKGRDLEYCIERVNQYCDTCI